MTPLQGTGIDFGSSLNLRGSILCGFRLHAFFSKAHIGRSLCVITHHDIVRRGIWLAVTWVAFRSYSIRIAFREFRSLTPEAARGRISNFLSFMAR